MLYAGSCHLNRNPALSHTNRQHTDWLRPSLHDGTYIRIPAGLSFHCRQQRNSLYLRRPDCAGVIAISYGTLLKKMSSFFPPVVTGTIVMTVGVSIFNLAIGNIAGGTSSPDFGAPINWAVGVFVVLVVLGFNVFGKGLPKVAAILIGMTAGYILSVILGLVSFSGIGEAAWFAVPKPFAFGVKFDLGYILMFVLLYFIVAVQMIGDFNVSCMGGLDREPTPDEIGGGATANGITSIISAVLNSFPTATYSQNSGIVALTKVCSRFVILVGCGILFLAGLCPKVGAVLSTIPNCVIGGGTVVVFRNDCHLRHEASCQGRVLQPELPDYRRIPGIRPGHPVLQRAPAPSSLPESLQCWRRTVLFSHLCLRLFSIWCFQRIRLWRQRRRARRNNCYDKNSTLSGAIFIYTLFLLLITFILFSTQTPPMLI